MNGVSPPNFTSVPNEILDTMADMEESELRVVLGICRKTFGWHKVRDRLSLTQLEKLTGLSRTAVHAGITAAMTRRIVERVRCGKQGFEYRILVASDYQSTEATSSVKLPEPDHSDYQQLVVSDYTQKKRVKEKRNDVVGALIDLGLDQGQAIGIVKDHHDLTVDDLAQWPEYLGRKKLGVGFLIKQLRSGQLVPPKEPTFIGNGNGRAAPVEEDPDEYIRRRVEENKQLGNLHPSKVR
jgi:phage replication O-like protein O